MRLIASLLVMTLLLSACAQTGLRNLRKPGDGPDEFSIVPSLPLEQPESYTALPTPTPGSFNRSDQRPVESAIAAVGGQATSPNAAVPSREAGIVNHASRFGREANIRASLAEDDAAFRKRQGRLSNIKIFREDSYAQIYRRQALDPGPVARQYRRAGIPTPSAPPSGRRR